jgi:hypothetical protein
LHALTPEFLSSTAEVVVASGQLGSFIEVDLEEVRQSARKDTSCAGTSWNSSGRSFWC